MIPADPSSAFSKYSHANGENAEHRRTPAVTPLVESTPSRIRTAKTCAEPVYVEMKALSEIMSIIAAVVIAAGRVQNLLIPRRRRGCSSTRHERDIMLPDDGKQKSEIQECSHVARNTWVAYGQQRLENAVRALHEAVDDFNVPHEEVLKLP